MNATRLKCFPGWREHTLRCAKFVILGSAGLSLNGFLPAAAKDPEPLAASPVEFADGHRDSGWIPFEFFNGSKIYLPVTVNGRITVAMLDSGATSQTVDTRLAADVGIRSEEVIAGEGFGGSQAMAIGHATISAGRMTIHGSEVVVFDHQPFRKMIGHDTPLTLGGEAFRNAVVDIDFGRRRLAFRDPRSFVPPANAQDLPLSGGNIRSVPLTIDGRTARMQLDLGNGRAAVLYQRFWQAAGYPGGRRTSTMMTGGTGGLNVQKLMMLDKVGLGASTFEDVPVILHQGKGDTSGASYDGNVGIGLLGRFHVIVDFPHNRLFLAAPIDTTTPFQVNHTGLSLLREGDVMVVGHIADGSPAAAAGFKVGDRIAGVREGSTRKAVALHGPWTMLPVGRTLHLRLDGGRTVSVVTARYY